LAVLERGDGAANATGLRVRTLKSAED
jgi:hypothetical protein